MTERRCPVCGRAPLTTTRPRVEQDVTVGSLYRHRARGRTWLHQIEFERSAWLKASGVGER